MIPLKKKGECIDPRIAPRGQIRPAGGQTAWPPAPLGWPTRHPKHPPRPRRPLSVSRLSLSPSPRRGEEQGGEGEGAANQPNQLPAGRQPAETTRVIPHPSSSDEKEERRKEREGGAARRRHHFVRACALARSPSESRRRAGRVAWLTFLGVGLLADSDRSDSLLAVAAGGQSGWGRRTTPRGWRWRWRPAPSSAPASSSRRSASCAPASAASAQVRTNARTVPFPSSLEGKLIPNAGSVGWFILLPQSNLANSTHVILIVSCIQFKSRVWISMLSVDFSEQWRLDG